MSAASSLTRPSLPADDLLTGEVACEARCVDPEAAQAARMAVGDSELREAALLLSALGDLTRLRLMTALLLGPLCTCDLAAVLGVSASAVSHQLRLLKDLHLVESRRDGRIVYHELAGSHVRQFVGSASEHAGKVSRASEVNAASKAEGAS